MADPKIELCYSTAWRYTQLANDRKFSLSSHNVVINLADMFGIIADYKNHEKFYRYQKISFHDLLWKRVSKIREERDKNLFIEPIGYPFKGHEFRIVQFDKDNLPDSFYPQEVNIGWRTEQYRSLIEEKTILHGYVKSKDGIERFLGLIGKWFHAWNILRDIQKIINKVDQNAITGTDAKYVGGHWIIRKTKPVIMVTECHDYIEVQQNNLHSVLQAIRNKIKEWMRYE